MDAFSPAIFHISGKCVASFCGSYTVTESIVEKHFEAVVIFLCQKTSLHNQVNMIAQFSAQSIDRNINVHWKAKHVECSAQHHKLHILDICWSGNYMY